MEKLLTLLTLFVAHSYYAIAQTANPANMLNSAAMDSSSNPGQYYLNYLKANIASVSDSNEADEDHEISRLYNLWLDRMPMGADKTLPFTNMQRPCKPLVVLVHACQKQETLMAIGKI